MCALVKIYRLGSFFIPQTFSYNLEYLLDLNSA